MGRHHPQATNLTRRHFHAWRPHVTVTDHHQLQYLDWHQILATLTHIGHRLLRGQQYVVVFLVVFHHVHGLQHQNRVTSRQQPVYMTQRQYEGQYSYPKE